MRWTWDELMSVPVDVYDVLIEQLIEEQRDRD